MVALRVVPSLATMGGTVRTHHLASGLISPVSLSLCTRLLAVQTTLPPASLLSLPSVCISLLWREEKELPGTFHLNRK